MRLGHLAAMVVVLAAPTLSRVAPPAFLSFQAPDTPLFSVRAELVVLHVMVKDRRGTYVSDLPADAFIVHEDDTPQKIQFFGAQDEPVTVGLLIDGSGSMLGAREQLAAAAAAFVETSNPQDEIFALVFNERVRAVLPPYAPFTSDGATLRAALTGAISPWGRTALYDAILAGLAYLERGRHQRKVLVVVGDGGDNVSIPTFEDVLLEIRASNATVYTVALVDPLQRDTNPKRLRQIARITGGEAFRPKGVAEIGGVLGDIARDIRHAYTIGYVPANSGRDGRVRQIEVLVSIPGQRGYSVRTRQGYSREER